MQQPGSDHADSPRHPPQPEDKRRDAPHAPPGDGRRSWLRMAAWVVGVFAASRAIVFVFTHLAVPQPVPSERLLAPLYRWDAAWYASIVRDGYEYRDDGAQHNIAFFPVYPLLTRVVVPFMPGYGDRPIWLALALVANAGALVGLFCVYLIVRQLGNEAAAAWAVCLAAFYPPSLFLSAGYTEGLFLALTAGAGLMTLRGRYMWAAVLLGFASGCRPTSIAFIPTLLYAAWRGYGRTHHRVGRLAAIAVISIGGLVLYMLYLAYRFGSPAVYTDNFAAWRLPKPGVYSTWDLVYLKPWWDRAAEFLAAIKDGAIHLGLMTAPYRTTLLWIPAALAISVVGLVRNRTPLRAHYLIPILLVAIPYWSSRGSYPTYEAISRYLTAAYPLYAAFGLWACRGNRGPLAATCIALMAALLTYASYCFALPGGPFVG